MNIAALVRAAANEHTPDQAHDARTALWRAVLALKSWLLIVTDHDGVVRPHVCQENGRGVVLAFTDEFIALRRQAERGLTFRSGFLTYEMQVGPALEALLQLPDAGTTDLRFNEGADSFAVPLDMIERLRRHVRDGNDVEALDATTAVAHAAGAPLAPLLVEATRDPSRREAAIDALLALPDWWFLCNPLQPDSFHVRRFAIAEEGGVVKRQAVVAFSEHRLALDATDHYGVADADGSVVLMQMPVGDVTRWLQSFLEHDVAHVMLDPLTSPYPIAIAELPAEWGRRHDTAGSD